METLAVIQSIFWIVLMIDITAVCVYLILVLKDLRTTIKKFGAWEAYFVRPISQIAETISGITELVQTGKLVTSLLSKRKDKKNV